MQSLGCHTIKAEIRSNDLDAAGGTANQRAQVIVLDSYVAATGQPSFGMKAGQTNWYGYAFKTNAGYVPHYDPTFGNFNAIMSFHSSMGGPLAPIMLEVQTLEPCNGSKDWNASACLTRAAQPHLGIQINGGLSGDANWPNEGDGLFTCHRYQGPVFVAGHLYRVQWKITWDAYQRAALQLWIDGVKYADVSGVSTLWRSDSTVDSGMYPVLENYRYYDSSLPTNDVYYGGLITGSTQTDVTVP